MLLYRRKEDGVLDVWKTESNDYCASIVSVQKEIIDNRIVAVNDHAPRWEKGVVLAVVK
jgi:hypothetical protein